MPIVADVPVVVVAAASFPIVTVGPVVVVVVALFPGFADAEAAATQICTNCIIEVLLFWANPLLKLCSLYTRATYLVMVHALHPGVSENS
jgi:hypothetical protein